MNIARKHILEVKPYIPGKPIEELKRELGLKEAIKLASNENAFPPSGNAIRAAKKALFSLNRYPDGGCFYLKKALSAFLRVRPENIVVGNGSDEIIVLAVRAFVDEGDEVIIARPTFLIYEIASQVHGAKIKFAPLKGLRYDIRGMAQLISKNTKMIFVANPDNPTGTYVTKEEIEFLVSKTPKDIILFFDEAYFEFAGGLSDYPNTMKYFRKKSVITTRTFSKIYSLAGLRVGYGIANEKIIGCLDRVREPFNVNSVAQAAAVAALEDPRHVEKTLKLIDIGKAYLYKEFDSLGIKYVPSATNFILFDTEKDGRKIYTRLLGRGIIVREMSPWKLKNYIRVTIGTMAENRKFVRVLKDALK